ncbi:MAG: response regulator [Pseudomonadota bacterium]|jgi:CheY-like chemotaxis protein
MRILAVDDDPVFLELLAAMLKTIGYSDITTMMSAENAVRELDMAGHAYDCILSDLQMPGMDGVAFTSAIRAKPSYRQTPILMITAMSGKSFVDDAFAAGATDYITKPLDVIELKARIGMVARLLAERRRLAEFARLVGQRAAAVEIEAEFETPILIPGFDRGIDYLAMENYLLTLGVKRMFSTSAFGIHIKNAGVIFNKASGATFVQMLGDVAATIMDALKTEDVLLAYAGSGTFVCVTEHDLGSNPEDIEIFMNIGLMDFESIYASDRLPVPQVRVGEVTRSSFLSPTKPTRVLERAIASAINPPDKKQKAGRLVA